MFHRSLLFALTLSAAVFGHEFNDELYDSSFAVHEEFMSFEDIMTGESDHHFIRGRELQTLPTCRATTPSNVYVCGRPGRRGDSCQSSSANCNGMTYDCTCTGSTERTCSYCRVQMSNAVACQVTGSSMTFTGQNSQLTTCSCEYVGNGQVRQTCFQPTPRPVALPTFSPVQSTTVRSPSLPVPVPAIPVPVPVVRAPLPLPVPASPTKQKKKKS